MSSPALADALRWMREGTTIFVGAVDRLSDDELRAPSALPGWTRAHVVGHIARNAEALGRLATWARTGVETPMYTSREQRDADIEASALLPVSRLRVELVDTALALATAFDTMSQADWQAAVRSAQGREIPASQVPWLRVREVWLHAVDLDSGTRVRDLPEGMLDALLDDVCGAMSGRPECPAAVLEPTDRDDRSWRLGPSDDATAVTVRGGAAELAGWLVGRCGGASLRASEGAVPEMPRWL
ncbi:MAG: maleylpyruvate isomerase family mycothiol-dependent enzyme [Pseudonocardia sp.]|nr:maleylpyruvate isomerase family mycothiol-dependent enzyme [Pseudonocardia sp.]